MNKYRSHNCNDLRIKDVGKKVLLSGWINKKRDHGNILFIDLREGGGERRYLTDITQKLKQRNIRFETRTLPSKLNDYLFVHRTSSVKVPSSSSSKSRKSHSMSESESVGVEFRLSGSVEQFSSS